MKANLLRRFSPLFVLFVVACNLDKSTDSNSGDAGGYGTLAPRIVSTETLGSADTVHLRIHLDSLNGSTVLDSMDLPDSMKSAILSGIPVGRKWVLKVFGTRKGDTVWSGTDTGTFLAAGSVIHSTSSGTVLVRNYTGRPTIARHDTAFATGATLYVGDTLVLTAPNTVARVTFSTDGSTPSCNIATDSMVRHLPVTSAASLSLKVVACQDGRWNSSPLSASWTLVYHDKILLATLLDTSLGTTLTWSDPISLGATNGLTISWKALLLPDTLPPDASAWSDLDDNGITKVGSSIDSAAIHSFVRKQFKLSDTAGRILAKAYVNNNNSAVDSVRFWWKIRMPVAPKPAPVLIHHDSANLVLAWPVVDSTKGTKVWIDTVRTAPRTSSSGDTISLTGLPGGKTVHIKLVGVDGASGRESDTVAIDATTLNPPIRAGFKVLNTDQTSGTVVLTLDSATRLRSGTVWTIGYAKSGQAIGYTYGTVNATDSVWSADINGGLIDIGVRATRDGYNVDSTVKLSVLRTKTASPGAPTGIALSRRDSSTLVWSWTQVTGRSYRVYTSTSSAFAADADTVGKDNHLVAVDSFKLSTLAPGEEAWIAVVALSGTSDSSGGNSSAAFSAGDTTYRVPVAPSFTVLNTDTAKGTVVWTIDNYVDSGSWACGTGSTSSGLSWRTTANATISQDSLRGALYFAVSASRNGYTKTTVVGPKTTKWTNEFSPAGPSGLELSFADTSNLEWTWNRLPNHVYKVYYQINTTSTSGLADTMLATGTATIDTGASKFSLIGLGSGVGVAIGVRTISAPDSTGKTLLLASSYGATKSKSNPVSSLVGTYMGFGNVRYSWTKVANAQSYDYSWNEGTTIVSIADSTLTVTVDTADTSLKIWVRSVSSDGVASAWRTATVHIPLPKTDWAAWYAGPSGVVRLLDTAAVVRADSVRFVAPWAATSGKRDFRTVLTTGTVQQIAVDTALLRAQPYVYVQYRWKSGDSTALYRFPFSYAAPSTPTGATFSVETMTANDSLGVTNLQDATGWTTYCAVHSVINGWESTMGMAVSGVVPKMLFGAGTDSIKTFLVHNSVSSRADSSAFSSPVFVDHRWMKAVDYQDGTSGSVPVTRINGRTWMAQNLNYDIPGDNMDGCFGNSSAQCDSRGRLYSISQALSAAGGHLCDTTYSLMDSSKCAITAQGVCPSGWHIPSSGDWASLTQVSAPSWFLSGPWVDTSGVADTVLHDPFGLNIVSSPGCYRVFGGAFNCEDTASRNGTHYYSITPDGHSQAVYGALFNYDGGSKYKQGIFAKDLATWYYNYGSATEDVSYYPVRCIKDE